MSRAASKWLSSLRPSSICSSCRSRLFESRPFSSTAIQRNTPKSSFDQALASLAANATPRSASDQSFSTPRPGLSTSAGNSFAPDGSLAANPSSIAPAPASISSLYSKPPRGAVVLPMSTDKIHHLHVYATKHNTHITLTNPNRDALISVSAGNIGARKAQRGTYDAAYQLAAWVMKQIPQKGQDRKWINDLKHVELVLRGFGPGREAVTKVILGSEGRIIRNKIVRITDATRLKFGGVRSRAQRRLG